MGGQTGFGPVAAGDDDGPPFAADWEARVYALAAVLRRRGLFNSDELRDAIERLPPREYLAASYYERWLGAIEMLVAERRVNDLRHRHRVLVRAGDPDHHTRVPGYLRGHTGEIIATLGRWPLPDDSARGITPPRVQTCCNWSLAS